MSIENIINDYIKKYDFGYDVEYLRNDKIIINEDADGHGIIVAHAVLYLEFLDDMTSENHLADMYVKINKTTKQIIDAHFKIRSEH